MGRSRKNKLPFFMNSARLRTAESYFKQNYSPTDLYRWRFISDEADSSDVSPATKSWGCNVPETDEAVDATLEQKDSELMEGDDNAYVHVRVPESQFTGLGFIWSSLQKLSVVIRSVIGSSDKRQDIEAPQTLEIDPQILNLQQHLVSEVPVTHTRVMPFNNLGNQCEHPPSEPHPMEMVALGKHISWDELGEINLADSEENLLASR